METYHIVHYSESPNPSGFAEFQEALGYSMRRYSMRHCLLTGVVSQEHFMDALQKSMQICLLVGIDSKKHFKKIYINDTETGVLYTDWLMTKKGFNLLIMQSPLLNEQIARWLWELSD